MGRKCKLALGITGGLLATAAAGLFLLERGITASAVRYGDAAARDFGGDRVQALVSLVECEACPLDERNRAVWALGQLEQADAVPILEKYRTGRRCDHKRRLCEYELDKAVRKIHGTSGLRPPAARAREAISLRR